MTLSSARAFSIAVLMSCCVSLASSLLRAQPKPPACIAPEYREFDFWVGDWDAHDADAPSKVVARNRVELILDRCVIHEVYDGFSGSHGEVSASTIQPVTSGIRVG